LAAKGKKNENGKHMALNFTKSLLDKLNNDNRGLDDSKGQNRPVMCSGSEIRCFITPGSGIEKSGSGIQNKHPGSVFPRAYQIFGLQ
jgi:hypothetical protein